ncbi:MAG: hypothetical protein IE916_05395 [Epsilonproteobacteria bacterium]|nr:hypothetical protein [Campylobacterota bacterium]
MFSFYLRLWLSWVLRFTLYTFFLTFALTLLGTFCIYAVWGFAQLTPQVQEALGEVALFLSLPAYALSLLISLFLNLKYLFNRCYGGYELTLLACEKSEPLEAIGNGDVVKIWRKWMMLNAWLVASMVIIVALLLKVAGSEGGLFGWFDAKALFGLLLVSGLFCIMMLGSKCKRVKVGRC